MTLCKEHIRFIDTYLENSEIRYADIRMEMVDHIASAIEAELEKKESLSFYDAFKAYMISNKAKLIHNNRSFIKNTDKNILKLMGLNVLTVSGFLVFLIALLGTRFLINNYGFETLETTFFSLPLLSLIALGLVYLVVLRVFDYDRFSGVERIGFVFMILYQLINFLQVVTRHEAEKESGYWIVAGVFAITCTLIYTFVKTAISIMRNYKLEYKKLV